MYGMGCLTPAGLTAVGSRQPFPAVARGERTAVLALGGRTVGGRR